MLLISQNGNCICPFPCAVRMGKYNGESYAVIANNFGQEYTLAIYKEVTPAKMEMARLTEAVSNIEKMWPDTFRFVRDV